MIEDDAHVERTEPGEVVADPALASELRKSAATGLQPLGRHDLDGIGQVELWRVTRPQ